MAESKLLWRVIYLDEKNQKKQKLRDLGSICSQNCQSYYFIVLDIFLVLTTSQD